MSEKSDIDAAIEMAQEHASAAKYRLIAAQKDVAVCEARLEACEGIQFDLERLKAKREVKTP